MSRNRTYEGYGWANPPVSVQGVVQAPPNRILRPMSVIEGVAAAAGGHRKVRSKVDAAFIRTLILTFLCFCSF